jgi:hypothetical protein
MLSMQGIRPGFPVFPGCSKLRLDELREHECGPNRPDPCSHCDVGSGAELAGAVARENVHPPRTWVSIVPASVMIGSATSRVSRARTPLQGVPQRHHRHSNSHRACTCRAG